jgi:hypothetical protein
MEFTLLGSNNYIARIYINYLVDSSIVVVSDTNVALKTTVASDQTLENSGANLTDGELANTWIAAVSQSLQSSTWDRKSD